MHLAERQQAFARALLDPTSAVPVDIVGPDGSPADKRFAVYRNNVVVGLIEALQANYPATCRIVGEEFFHAMARAYIIQEPPTSPILLDYGVGFPDFVERFEPVRSLPYLRDVARIERAWTEAYHAAEALSLDANQLATVPSDQIPCLRFELHPSLRNVRSPYPALTIWRMNVANGTPAPVDLDAGGEDALILRPGTDVEVRSLPPGGGEFITGLAAGLSLSDATKISLNESSAFDLTANLSALIAVGAIVGFSLSGVETPSVEVNE